MRLLLAALAATVMLVSNAEARTKPQQVSVCMDSFVECLSKQPQGAAVVSGAARGSRVAAVATQVLPHPEGCPRIAFCGCGASVAVFGKSVRSLWLAANWFQFPHADPAPGMVAVRRHHVFVIEQVLEGGKVLAYDANSGGHLTRRHVRSLAGFSVRNPHGTRFAALTP